MTSKETDAMWKSLLADKSEGWMTSGEQPVRPGVYHTYRKGESSRPLYQRWDDGKWSVRCTSISGALECPALSDMPNPDAWRHIGMALGDDGAPDFTIGRQHFEPKPGHGPAPEPASALDTQVGGDHYKKLGDYQPWAVLKAWLTPEEFRGYMKGTAIAYLARERDKGGDQDVHKAAHTLQGLVEMLEAK